MPDPLLKHLDEGDEEQHPAHYFYRITVVDRASNVFCTLHDSLANSEIVIFLFHSKAFYFFISNTTLVCYDCSNIMYTYNNKVVSTMLYSQLTVIHG